MRALWVILMVAAAVALYYLVPLGAKIAMRSRFLARIRRSGRVCLTFDDGPHPETTPRILALLSEAGVKATFYVLGRQAEQFPYLISSILAQGHEIGEHGYGHLHAWKSGPWRTARDLLWGREALTIRGVADPRRGFRPPYGKLNLATLVYAWTMRRRVAFWNVDPRDYDEESAQEVAQRVLKRLVPGRVVLLHDGRARRDANPEVTVVALRLILEDAITRNFNFATVGEALGTPAPGDRRDEEEKQKHGHPCP